MSLSFLIGQRLLVTAAVCLFGLLWSAHERAAALASRPFTGAARKLNTARRSLKDRAYRGVVITGAILAFGYALGASVSDLARTTGWGMAIETLLLLCLVEGRVPLLAARLYRRLRAGNRAEAEALLRHVTGLDGKGQDDAAFIRLAIDQCARVSLRGFWLIMLAYLAAGAAGAVCAFLLGATYAHGRPETEENRTFYYSLAALLALLDGVAGRLAGAWAWGCSLFVPTLRNRAGLAALVRRHGGWLPLHGALLGLTLGGPRRLYGRKREEDWIDGPTLDAGAHDLRRYGWLEGLSRILFLMATLCAGLLLESPRTLAAVKTLLHGYGL